MACNNWHNTKGWKSSVTFNHDVIQRAAKNNCTSCHQKPNDSFHQSIAENCDKCHSTAKWAPSTFDHSVYFELEGDHNVKCNTCHTTNNFSTYTCYGCHEHSENKIMEEHTEHGIDNFSKCASCHRNANEHDIRMNDNVNGESNNVKEYIKTQEKESKKKHNGEKKHDDD